MFLKVDLFCEVLSSCYIFSVYTVLCCSDSRADFFVHRPEMVVGWYHSHPGFGCWLSGVDINTQQVCVLTVSLTHQLCI